jgi:hypothetical protein
MSPKEFDEMVANLVEIELRHTYGRKAPES